MSFHIATKEYAAEYRFKNCYKCPYFYSGYGRCKGTPIEVSFYCTWSEAKWLVGDDFA